MQQHPRISYFVVLGIKEKEKTKKKKKAKKKKEEREKKKRAVKNGALPRGDATLPSHFKGRA